MVLLSAECHHEEEVMAAAGSCKKRRLLLRLDRIVDRDDDYTVERDLAMGLPITTSDPDSLTGLYLDTTRDKRSGNWSAMTDAC